MGFALQLAWAERQLLEVVSMTEVANAKASKAFMSREKHIHGQFPCHIVGRACLAF